MKLLSRFLLTAMILLVFKRNNWREDGHLVSAFSVNEMFWSLYFCYTYSEAVTVAANY